MFCKTLAPPSALCVDHNDIIVASYSIDTFNVIYCPHMLILLICLRQIYVYSSPNTSLITRNALKNNNDGNCFQKSSTAKNKITTIFYERQCYANLEDAIYIRHHW